MQKVGTDIKLNIVYFGTPEFSVPTLEALYNNPNVNILKVISMPDRPKGRGMKLQSPPVIEFAKQRDLPFFQTQNINKEPELLKELETLNIDVFIVLAFAQFLGGKLLNLPRKGCFNIHTSLLPKFRGAAPIQYAIMNGDTTTGVSIQRMVSKMDAGDVCLSKEVEILKEENGETLSDKLQKEAANSIQSFISQLASDSLKYETQDEGLVSFAPTLNKSDGLIDFKNMSVKDIFNRVRGLDPWPGTYCFLGKKRLKIKKIEIEKENITSPFPGKVDITFGTLSVSCIDGVIRLRQIQLEGKKESEDGSFLRGYKGDLEINPEINL